MEEFGPAAGVLVKVLDSAERACHSGAPRQAPWPAGSLTPTTARPMHGILSVGGPSARSLLMFCWASSPGLPGRTGRGCLRPRISLRWVTHCIKSTSAWEMSTWWEGGVPSCCGTDALLLRFKSPLTTPSGLNGDPRRIGPARWADSSRARL